MNKIGITLGDPSGIGPEIVAKAVMDKRIKHNEIVLIGNRENFLETADSINIPRDYFKTIQFSDVPGTVFPIGEVSGESGRVARVSIEKAVEFAMKNEIGGICTAPINKEALLSGGSKYKDHTQMLSGLTGQQDVVTVFEVEQLRIIFLSKHVSLKKACELVTKDNVMDFIRKAKDSLHYLGVKGERIAVAALNPHSGESGLFGNEEVEEILPAVEMARKQHYNVVGPIPADSVFSQAASGRYDIVVSMYHDQGHIAAKMLDFSKTVSMNLGLPFLRTSVDHGTAFDIAGKGIADHTSMIEAILKCSGYSQNYRRYWEDLNSQS